MQNNGFDLDFNISYSLDDNLDFFQLPQQIQCDFNGKRVPINIKEKVQQLPENIRDPTLKVVNTLSEHLKIWDLPEDHQINCYAFKLPPSSFYGNCEIFPYRPDLLQNEYHNVQNLSSAQISQIFDDGTFEMPSQQFPIPYVWQLSQLIVKGRKNINKSYYEDIGAAYKVIKISPTYIYSTQDSSGHPCTLRSGIYNLCCKFTIFLSIFIGFRETVTYCDKFKLEKQIEEKRQFALRQLESLNRGIYEYLKFTNDEEELKSAEKKKMHLLEISNILEQQQQGLRLQLQNQYDAMMEQFSNTQRIDDPEEQKEYLDHIADQLKLLEDDFMKKYEIKLAFEENLDQQIEEAKNKAQKQFLFSNFPQNRDTVEHIIQLNECKRSVNYYNELKDDELKELLNEFEQKLIENHPIRSQSSRFKDLEKQDFLKAISPQLREKYRLLLVTDIKKQNISDIEIYLQYHSVKKELKKQLKELMEVEEVKQRHENITIRVTRQCFPPYKVIKTGSYYSLERKKQYHITSQCFFWKIQLIIVRYFAWTANVVYWLFANGISGPLGIRALFSCSQFHPDVTINSNTGVVSPSHYRVTPVIRHLQYVCEGMKASRDQFENSPDTGFFGKNCARICNYIEVYFFRLIIVGIIGVLIIMPVLILLNFAFSIVLALTAWLWIPVVLILIFLFQVCFYDFDVAGRDKFTIISSPEYFPIIVNMFNFLIKGVCYIVLNIIFVFVIMPISSLFMILFGHLRYCLRSLYDCIMILFVRCLGRVPASENSLAWKISGPGISRGYYFSIKNEQVIILVAAELERCILSEYESRMKELINAPQYIVQKIMIAFFQLFGASYNFHDAGSDSLRACLNKQIEERIKQLPTIRNQIRFNDSELQIIRIQIKQFIKCQIKLKSMNNYIWNRFNVQKGDYNQLTETILIKIFGSQILQPLEAIDIRFQLQTEENYDFGLKVQKALKGQVNLDQPENYIQKQSNAVNSKKVMKRYLNFKEIVEEVWSCQSLQQSWSSLSSKYRRFYLNYCLRVQED